MVARSKWQHVDGLLDNVSLTGRRLVEAQPKELVIANIVRRVLSLIRDEAVENRDGPPVEATDEVPMTPLSVTSASFDLAFSSPVQSFQDAHLDAAATTAAAASAPPRPGLLPSYSSVNIPRSLFRILSTTSIADLDASTLASPSRSSGTSTPLISRNPQQSQLHALRSEVIDGIEEIKDEISQVDDQIAALADVQIHPGDHVLLYQPSPTVQRFILRAALKRKFAVLLAAEPSSRLSDALPYSSFKKKLAAAGISVINIHNAGLMAYMPLVQRLVIGARAVIANGGVVADAGAAAAARAAKEYGRPVIVLAGVYKLSLETPFDEESLIEWGDSSTFVSFADGPAVNGVEVRTAMTELIPPELVDIYITNL